MTATAHPRRALALALVTALGATALADTAAAQTAAPSFQVIELNYAPAQQTPGLDLRPGRYLLQLRRDTSGGYEGLLRGPRNELVADRIEFSAGSSCANGLPPGAALSTRGVAGQIGLNLVAIEIGSAGSSCTLQAVLPHLGLTHPEKPPQFLDCEPPVELEQMSTGPTTDPGPACNIEKWDPPLSAARPDVKPGRTFNLAGRSFKWVEVARLSAIEARDFRDGRCVFDYAFVAENAGAARSLPSDASLVLGSRLGPVLDARSMGTLAPGGIQRIEGQVALPPGLWQIFAHVDSSARIAEWDGQNNARSLIVEVSGRCGP